MKQHTSQSNLSPAPTSPLHSTPTFNCQPNKRRRTSRTDWWLLLCAEWTPSPSTPPQQPHAVCRLPRLDYMASPLCRLHSSLTSHVKSVSNSCSLFLQNTSHSHSSLPPPETFWSKPPAALAGTTEMAPRWLPYPLQLILKRTATRDPDETWVGSCQSSAQNPELHDPSPSLKQESLHGL